MAALKGRVQPCLESSMEVHTLFIHNLSTHPINTSALSIHTNQDSFHIINLLIRLCFIFSPLSSHSPLSPLLPLLPLSPTPRSPSHPVIHKHRTFPRTLYKISNDSVCFVVINWLQCLDQKHSGNNITPKLVVYSCSGNKR